MFVSLPHKLASKSIITNTKRRESLPGMAHQVAGPNLLLRSRKTEQNMGFKVFGEPQWQWEPAGSGLGEAGPEQRNLRVWPGHWSYLVFEATTNSESKHKAGKLSKAFSIITGLRIFQNWWKQFKQHCNYKENHYLDTLLENCWKSKTKRNLKSNQRRLLQSLSEEWQLRLTAKSSTVTVTVTFRGMTVKTDS